jgi:hypothetical protein
MNMGINSTSFTFNGGDWIEIKTSIIVNKNKQLKKPPKAKKHNLNYFKWHSFGKKVI